jgi:hypothetical protein
MKLKRLAALFVLVLSFAARALPADTWLVVIGNNEGGRLESDLLYAERDARELAEVFRQHGPVASERIQLLLGANSESVLRAMLETNTRIRAAARDGRPSALVVFYSGHADAAALHLGGTEIAFDELKALVESSPASVRLLVVDSCRSGAVTRVKGVTPAESFELSLHDEVATSGLAILTSSSAGEQSQESDRLRGSFFTHHLLNALRGAADQDGDGKVTLSEAYAYTYAQTIRSSGETMTLQHPTYSWDLKGRGALVLSEPQQLRGRVGRIRLAQASTYVVLEGNASGAVTAEVTPQSARREISLPAGAYFLQQRMPDEVREFNITLAPGGTVDLAGMPFRRVQYDRLVRQRGGSAAALGVVTMAGVRGETLAGEGATPQALLGLSVDFPSLTAGLRLRGSTASSPGVDGLLPRRHNELGLGVVVEHFVDFREVSVGFGASAEGTMHRQSFDAGLRAASTRTSWGAAFTALLALERHLPWGLALHLEGGPQTLLLNTAVERDGAQVSSGRSSPLVLWLAGGLIWRR